MKKLLLILIIYALFFAVQLDAWSYHTHRKIAAEAFRLMPPDFVQRYESQKKAFLKGSTDPDILIKDFSNHVYHIDGTQTGGLYRIVFLYKKAVELMISGESDAKTAYLLGLMSHYIADLNQPLHTAGRERDPEEDTCHARYERDVNRYLRHLEYPDFQPVAVDSPETRIKDMAQKACVYYDCIGQAYRQGNEIQDLLDVTEKQVGASIRNVADFWLAVCRDAGRKHHDREAEQTAQVWTLNENEEKSSPGSININKATKQELSDFFNISLSKAGRIVDQRPYRSVYDLARTKVFNPMYIKRNKDRIKLK